MPLLITDDTLEKAALTPDELRLEIAVMLFQKNRFTLGQVAEFTGLHQLEVQRELARRRIPLHYSLEDLEEDVKTLGL